MRRFYQDYRTFELVSWGRGIAYALTHKASGLSVFVQGDDATRFEDDRLNIEQAFPDMTDEDVMSYLWDQCDYGSAATDQNI